MRSAPGVSITCILGKCLLAQLDWWTSGTTKVLLSREYLLTLGSGGKECSIVFWLWCYSIFGVRPMVPPKSPPPPHVKMNVSAEDEYIVAIDD